MNAHDSMPGRGKPAVAESALIGLVVLLGWSLCDFATFLMGGAPWLVVRTLGPGSAMAWGIGALIGALSVRWRAFLPAVILLALGVSIGASLVDPVLPTTQRWLARTVFVLSASMWVALHTPMRWRLSRVHLAFVLGAAGCLATIVYRDVVAPYLLTTLVGGALGSFALLTVAHRRLRNGLILCVLAVVLWRFASRASGIAEMKQAKLGPAVTGNAAAMSKAPNLVFIVIDTLRADHVGSYGYGRDTTPRLDSFAEAHATRYTRARSTGPFTLSSHGSLFTGLYPSEHGATIGAQASRALYPEVVTLAERLRGAGYQTAAVFSNLLYLNERLGFHRGFEDFDTRLMPHVPVHLALPQLAGLHVDFGRVNRRGDVISDRAIEWLETRRRDGPFFLALNYLDPHSPYIPAAGYGEFFSTQQPRDVIFPERGIVELQYDRCIRFADAQVGRVLDKLKELDLFDNSVIVVTSDHGEGLEQHGLSEHCWLLYEELLQVPLLIKPAAGRIREVNDHPITGAEVHDRVVELLGLEPDAAGERPAGIVGEWYPWPLHPADIELGNRIGRDMTLHLVTWMRGSVKTIVSSNGDVESFDLVRDPREEHPLDLDAEQVEAAGSLARAWWELHPFNSEVPEISREELNSLEDLGYGG